MQARVLEEGEAGDPMEDVHLVIYLKNCVNNLQSRSREFRI